MPRLLLLARFNPSFFALPSISQSYPLPHFATHPRFATYVQLDVDEVQNKWIEKSPVHAGFSLLLIYPLQKLAPVSLMGADNF